jgi:biopolymer transport protein ExbD
MAPKRRDHDLDTELNITSLMDIMTIILVFLLKSYSTEDIQIAPSENLLLPVSSADRPPELAVNTVISKIAITVDGVDVVAVSGNQVGEQDKRGTLITPLFDSLKAAADQAKANAVITNKDGDLTGVNGGVFTIKGLVQDCNRDITLFLRTRIPALV